MPIPRIVAKLIAPVFNLVLPFVPVDDPWERLPTSIPATTFGRGSRHDFRWYFEGTSVTPADSLDAICEWLLDCEYVSDPELFNEPDFWQHPRTFEQLRRGDCEDHALWAWRKLIELGLHAEFVCGRWDVSTDDPGAHAWVLFRDGGVEYVLESVDHTRATMIQPLADVRAHYRPHMAVNAKFVTTGFSGYIFTLKEERAARRAGGRAKPASITSPAA